MHNQAETEHELKSVEQALEERTGQSRQLQEDCKSITAKMSSLSKEER